MNAKIINPFLSAGLSTFESMFSIAPTNKEPYLLQVDMGHPWEISGLLGVTGDYNGVVAFRLHKGLSLQMLELMATGLVSEFTNIIAGNAVSMIPDVNLKVSPPVTVSGRNHVISWPRNYPVIAIPFVTKHGPFEVDVCFK